MKRGNVKLRLTMSVVLLGLAAGGLIAWQRIWAARRDDCQAQAARLSLELAQELGAQPDIGSDESEARARAWAMAHPESFEVFLRPAEGAERRLRSGGSDPTGLRKSVAKSEVAIIRDGKTVGRLEVAVEGHASESLALLSGPSAGWVVGGCLAVFAAVWAPWRRRRSEMSGLWTSAQERVKQTLDFLGEGIAVLDASGRIVFANREFGALLGKAPEQWTGFRIDDLSWEVAADARREGGGALPWREAARPDAGQVQCRAAVVIGERGPVVLSASFRAIRSRRRVLGVICSFQDITALERQREELREARDAAQQASRAKSSFLANMSHEIRTPINGVMGTLDLLDAPSLSAGQRRYLQAGQTSASALLHLVNDILDFSKIEAGKLDLCAIPFDPAECIHKTMQIVRGVAAGKGLELILRVDLPAGLRLSGDPDRLRQIVLNLVTNAVKFTTSGEVEVRVRGDEGGEGRFVLRVGVRDTGIGIPADRLDRLFRSFSQVDESTSRTYGGTGLGLAISKQLVEMMSGSVRVESEPGAGSMFSFDVRLARVDVEEETVRPDSAREAGEEKAEFRVGTVVMLEPVRTAARGLRDRMKTEGLEGEVVSTLAELRSAADRVDPGVVIIGCHAWTDEHAAAVRDVRSAHPGVMVIAMTMEEVSIESERGLAGVVDAWWSKPLGPALLTDQISSVRAEGAASERDAAEAMLVVRDAEARIVLVAEDNPVGQLVTKEYLHRMGLRSIVTERGDDAVRQAAEQEFDLILMDCHLPGLDGYEATRRIRQDERERGRRPAKIIALTASAMVGDRDRCLEAGMDDYITKPIDRANFIACVCRSLGTSLVRALIQTQQSDEMPRPKPETAPACEGGAEVDPPLAMPQLAARCLMRRDIMVELLDLFEQATNSDLARLDEAMSRQDRRALSEAAHSLAGGALQVGATALARLAKQVENSPATVELADLEQKLGLIREEFQRCVGYLPTARACDPASLRATQKKAA